VNNDKKVDVIDWRDIPQPIVSTAVAPRRFCSPPAIGVLGTLLIHALIVPSAIFGSRVSEVRPSAIQNSSAHRKITTDPKDGLVLINLPTVANSNQEADRVIVPLPVLANAVKSHIDPDPPATLNIEILSLNEEQASGPAQTNGDGAEAARLFGIYTGQIQARIDRVWRRPRTPVSESGGASSNDEAFQCEAEIVQDGHGNVQEILLPRCSGTSAWQRSLVMAIQQASPLPAPPSPKVFNRSIALDFVGIPYEAGRSDEEYEIPSHPPAQAGEAAGQEALTSGRSPTDSYPSAQHGLQDASVSGIAK
jgi:hypothetical protein